LTRAFRGRAEVHLEAIGDVFASFTSRAVPVAQLANVSATADGPIEKLARALIRESVWGNFDLVIAVDDVELVNVGSEHLIHQWFGAVIANEVKGLTHAQLAKLQARASFHLLAPMVEAYFFGDAAALTRLFTAADLAQHPSWSTTSPLLESFSTADATYTNRTAWPDLPNPPKLDAWRNANRERHPKHYVEYLCKTHPRGYREGTAGVAALKELDFAQVVARGTPCLSDLLADIENALGLPPQLGATGQARPSTVLRNL
jgi:hypothetical protein